MFNLAKGKKSAASSAGGAPQKTRAVASDDKDVRQAIERLESFTSLLGKFSLSHDFYMRIFKAILLTVIKLPRSLEFCKRIKQATKDQHEKVLELSHNLRDLPRRIFEWKTSR